MLRQKEGSIKFGKGEKERRWYESNLYLHDYPKSEYGIPSKAGTTAFGAGCVSENTGMGAGQHESAGFGVGETYTGGVRTAFFLFLQIPRLGKEFDLLQIKEEQILNLELKSGQVSDEAIRKQLIQNRYYLAALGKPIRSYTYISSQNRLVRLTNHDRIVEADWEQLCRDLQQESADYPGDIEDCFRRSCT